MIPEQTLRRICFLRALYEVDRTGILITEPLLLRAGREIPAEVADLDKLDRLSLNLERHLAGRHHLEMARYYASERVLPVGWLAAACFLLGLVSNYLGPAHKVNLLLNPMIGLYLWNFAVYLLLLVRLPLPHRPKNLPDGWLAALGRRCGDWLRTLGRYPGARQRLLLQARVQFQRHWLAEQARLVGLRLVGLLHLLAACLTLGVIAGLYLRGLVWSYSFTWQSTFISRPETFEKIMGFLFAPILRLVPGVFHLGDQSGAAWIHLFSLAALVYILLPRTLLWAWSRRRARQLAGRLTLDCQAPAYLALLAPLTGGRRQLEMFCYSFNLDEARRNHLLATARRIWGEGLLLGVGRRIDWGVTAVELPPDDGQVFLLVFNGVQTPEDEVQGAFASDFLAKLPVRARAGGVIVDASAVPADQRENRSSAWTAVLETAHAHPFAWLDLSSAAGDEELKQLARAVRGGAA